MDAAPAAILAMLLAAKARRFMLRLSQFCPVRVTLKAVLEKAAALPLASRTPLAWGAEALADPIALLIDHAFLEMKAAQNAMEMMTRWPNDWTPGWVETMTSVARDETAHLSQVSRLLIRRGGRLERGHKSTYAAALRALVRTGKARETLDRLCVSALIEARSCERFAVLAATTADAELAKFYQALFSSEMGHYKVFLKLAYKMASKYEVDVRWQELRLAEARIIEAQPPGSRIHSGITMLPGSQSSPGTAASPARTLPS